MNEQEKKAIEYLTKYIHWETYGERSLELDIETTLNLIEKLNNIIKNAIDYIQNNNKELKSYNKQEMIDWLYGLDKCCITKIK